MGSTLAINIDRPSRQRTSEWIEDAIVTLPPDGDGELLPRVVVPNPVRAGPFCSDWLQLKSGGIHESISRVRVRSGSDAIRQAGCAHSHSLNNT